MKLFIKIFFVTLYSTLLLINEIKGQTNHTIKGKIINNIDTNRIIDVNVIIEGDNYKNEIMCFHRIEPKLLFLINTSIKRVSFPFRSKHIK